MSFLLAALSAMTLGVLRRSNMLTLTSLWLSSGAACCVAMLIAYCTCLGSWEVQHERAKRGDWYKEIDGVSYKRELLDKANRFARKGAISVIEARELWAAAQADGYDGKGVTNEERLTLLYTMRTLKYSAAATAFLKPLLEYVPPEREEGGTSAAPGAPEYRRYPLRSEEDSEDSSDREAPCRDPGR